MSVDETVEEYPLAVQRVQIIDLGEGLLLKRGRTVVKIDGTDAADAVQSILAFVADGGATRREICELFAAPDRPAVESLVQALEERRILAPPSRGAEPPGDEPLDIFCWHFGKTAHEVARNLDAARIVILGVNCISRQLATALAASGLGRVTVVDYPLLGNVRLFADDGTIRNEEWPAALDPPTAYQEWLGATGPAGVGCLVATSDFGGQHLLRSWNEHCVREGVQFLPVVLQDLVGYVGPLVVPKESACLECLRARENANMDDPDVRRAPEHAAYEGQVVNAFHPSMASILGDLAAIELVKFHGQLMRSRIVGRQIEVNLVAPQLVERRVLKLPACPVCGPARFRSPVSQDKRAFVPGHEIAR
jgi:bacteriocin biosynthesis cyclodehydratase domain-containing protein